MSGLVPGRSGGRHWAGPGRSGPSASTVRPAESARKTPGATLYGATTSVHRGVDASPGRMPRRIAPCRRGVGETCAPPAHAGSGSGPAYPPRRAPCPVPRAPFRPRTETESIARPVPAPAVVRPRAGRRAAQKHPGGPRGPGPGAAHGPSARSPIHADPEPRAPPLRWAQSPSPAGAPAAASAASGSRSAGPAGTQRARSFRYGHQRPSGPYRNCASAPTTVHRPGPADRS